MRGELGSPAPNEIENGVKAARFRAFQKNNLRSKGPAGLIADGGASQSCLQTASPQNRLSMLPSRTSQHEAGRGRSRRRRGRRLQTLRG
jgi:hypothetical protein